MAESFVSTILEKLARILAEEALPTDAGDELRKLSSNLKAIHAVLTDAEEKQVSNQSLKLWLDRLKDAAYDAEDVLDDWSAALFELQASDGNQNASALKGEVCPIISSCLSSGNDVSRYDIGLRLKEINKTLDEIAQEKDRYQLATMETGQPRPAQNTSSVGVSEIHGRDDAEKDIFGPLLLSYFDLPSELRRCLLYCVIFPKGFTIWTNHLIYHWMAQGYLGIDENAELELIGRKYFDYLASRSFFQDFGINENGIVLTCKMNDLAHDFAKYLVGDEFVTKEVKHEEDSRIDISSDMTRHVTVKLAEGVHFPVSVSGVGRLRSLVTFSGEGAITSEAMRNIFNQAIHLRVLDLSWPDGNDHLDESIPEEIGKMKQLRHLNLSYGKKLTELPETLCELYNLQFLMLKGCRNLQKLPDNFGQLINLRYFRSNFCDSLTYYPKGIGRLTSLRNLYEIIVRADRNDNTEFSLGDLERLDNLYEVLRLKLVGNGIDASEAKRARLQNKVHLKELRIKLAGEISENDVIEALNRPSTLNVRFYNLEEPWYYPEWLKDACHTEMPGASKMM